MQILGLFFTNSKDGKQKSYDIHKQKSLLRRPPYRYGGLRSKRKFDFYAISSSYLIRALTTRTLPSEKVSHTILTPLNGVADITPARL